MTVDRFLKTVRDGHQHKCHFVPTPIHKNVNASELECMPDDDMVLAVENNAVVGWNFAIDLKRGMTTLRGILEPTDEGELA